MIKSVGFALALIKMPKMPMWLKQKPIYILLSTTWQNRTAYYQNSLLSTVITNVLNGPNIRGTNVIYSLNVFSFSDFRNNNFSFLQLGWARRQQCLEQSWI